MNPTLLRALAALVPVAFIVIVSVAAFLRSRNVPAFVQLAGATCLLLVVLTHICEGLRWFERMQWGERHGAGHYLDLTGAVLGVILFPVGYLLRLRRGDASRTS
jgi:hypothetical protein